MRNRKTVLQATLAILALAAAAGCTSDLDCGAGTRADGDRCLPVCGPGAEIDPQSGDCVATCVEHTRRDAESGACLPDSSACVSGQAWEAASASCIRLDGLCSAASLWVASEGRCVREDLLRTADLTEGEAENDPARGGPGAFERLTLPAIGGQLTLRGAVDLPVDHDGDGWREPDWDLWVFEAAEPMVLRVTADGLGGATSGFQVMSLDAGPRFTRYGMGTTSTRVTRDLFLPRAGLYALVASDALNFVSGGPGPHHGGGTFGYFVTLERLPVPAPTPVPMALGFAEVEGAFPLAPPADGTMLGFYTVPLDALALYRFELRSGSIATPGILSVVDGSGLVFSADRPLSTAFLEPTEALLVADFVWFFATADVGYQIRVIEQPMGFFDATLPQTTLVQGAWNASMMLESTLLGFEARAGEVATVSLTSSTGATCFTLLDRTLTSELAKAGCTVGVERPASELRFFAPATGVYGLATIDWQGGLVSNGFLYQIPYHRYDVTADVVRQAPRSVGRLEGPWIASGEELTGALAERFYRVDPGPEAQAFWGEVTTALDPVVSLYGTGLGPFLTRSVSKSPGFALRSPDGAPVLVGVRDRRGAAGSYDLRLEPMPIAELGKVAMGGAIEVTETLPAGSARRFVHVESDRIGLLGLTVTPPPGVDLAIVRRDVVLGPLHPEAVDEAGAGGAETAVRALNFQGAFFEIVTADGRPVAADAEVSIRAVLRPSTLEAELNNSPEQAQRITAPIAINGTLRGIDDVDVFRVEVTEPTVLFAEVLPTGDAADVWTTRLEVLDGNGRSIGSDSDSGEGYLSRLEVTLPQAGVYSLSIDAAGRAGFYLLEVTTRAR